MSQQIKNGENNELNDKEYIEIDYNDDEKSKELVQDILNDILPKEKEKDADDVGFTADYKVTEIIYPNNKSFYIVHDYRRKRLFLIHDNHGEIYALVDEISDKVTVKIITKYFNDIDYYIDNDAENWCFAKLRNIDRDQTKREKDKLEINIQGKIFSLYPDVYKGNAGYDKVLINCGECIDILISLIRKNYQLKKKIEIN